MPAAPAALPQALAGGSRCALARSPAYPAPIQYPVGRGRRWARGMRVWSNMHPHLWCTRHGHPSLLTSTVDATICYNPPLLFVFQPPHTSMLIFSAASCCSTASCAASRWVAARAPLPRLQRQVQGDKRSAWLRQVSMLDKGGSSRPCGQGHMQRAGHHIVWQTVCTADKVHASPA